MSCVKNIFLIIFLNIFVFTHASAQNLQLDTVYFVKKNDFFTKTDIVPGPLCQY